MLYVKETPNGKLQYLDTTGFRPMTDEELEARHLAKEQEKIAAEKRAQAQAIKKEIADYKRLFEENKYLQEKYVDGALTEEEYAPIREMREGWRVEIRRLEEELKNLEA